MDSDELESGLEIAVIGMAARLPGAPDVDTYWRRLCAGDDCLTRFTDAELLAAGVPAARLADPAYVKVNGVLEGAELFDAGLFGYSPREAASIDPQQRVFLETAWTALEHAGYDASRSGRGIGVYVGVGRNTYLYENAMGDAEDAEARLWHPAVIGNDKDFLATRISYKLNLEGPSMVVQTACSTSLVAIHVAVQALLGGECDMALAGGATIRLPQIAGYRYQQEGILSPDGRCRAFDAAANGCVPGSGAGAVVLKRLADARADGDTIHAVIKGTAVNNDGAAKAGYTAPRVDGQAAVIRAAQRVAGVSADSIGYVEAHGTGTLLGDPIEIAALTQAFRQDSERVAYCAIGSAKTNIGHLDTAAGVAGFIKAVLTVKHGIVPPSLNYGAPNPKCELERSPFFVNAELRPWPGGAGPRRAAVSAFGIGGTNAHAILEQPPAPPAAAVAASAAPVVLLASARTPAALTANVAALGAHLAGAEGATQDIADVAWTTQCGRRAFGERRAFVCADRDEARRALDGEAPACVVQGTAPRQAPTIAWLFPGQGSQYLGMGRGLYAAVPRFRATVDHCADLLARSAGLDLRALLLSGSDAATLADTRVAQPALFTVEYALAELFAAHGITPVALLGHSLGEYVAACRAGVFSLEDGLALVAERGRLMADVPRGAMLAVPLPAAEVETLLDGTLDIAAINAPGLCVVAGESAAVAAFDARLAARGVEARPLDTSHAFHSRMLDPVLEAFGARVARLALAAPHTPYVSNLTGEWITPAQATSPDYWVAHLRRPVQFAAALATLLAGEARLLLELGPGQAMSALARRNGADAKRTISTLPGADVDEARAFATALARLWTAGAPLDWQAAHAGVTRRRVPLPGYQFERQRHWLEPAAPRAARDDALRKVTDVSQWFYAPSWKRLPPLPPRGGAGQDRDDVHWLVFADNGGLGARLGALLRERGARVSTVVADEELNQVVAGFHTMRAGHAGDMDGLLQLLRAHHGAPARVLHCWGLNELACTAAEAERGLALNFHALIDLVQALERAGLPALEQVVAVTGGAQSVLGEPLRAPFAAASLGVVRVLAAEAPLTRTRHVDIEFDAQHLDALAAQVLDEADARDAHRVVALRRGLRWAEGFEPLPLPAATQCPAMIRPRGRYLVTGGLRGVGLATAEYLARVAQARLALCTRSAFPPRARWDALASGASTLPLPELDAFMYDAEARVLADRPLTELAEVPGLRADLEALCAAHAWQTLARLHGAPLANVSLPDAALRARVVPAYQRHYDALLRWLVADGRLRQAGATLVFGSAPPAPAARLAAASARHPAFTTLLNLLDQCGRHTAQVLDGRLPGLEVLFGEDGLALFRAGSALILEHSRMRIQHALLRALVEQWLAGREADASAPPLTMLEVGGGEGHLAWTLAPALAGRGVEYRYTDIAPSFAAAAEREARRRGIDGMRFGVLDLERDLPAQGQADASVDVVLAFNVIHATRDVAATLRRLARALKPGGALLLIESLRSEPWVDAVWGLTEGWWHYTDGALRGPSPLLEVATWRTVLADAGLAAVEHWPRDSTRADAALLVARKPADATAPALVDTEIARTIAALRRIEAAGGEVEILQADVSDAASVQALLAACDARLGGLDGVFHSALVLHDSAAALKTRAEADAVFAPKVRGTLLLAEALRGRALDCFVAYSSLAAVIGIPGQVDYSAASNVLDAWATAEAQSPAPLARVVTTIDWGAWRDTGMAARLARQRGEKQRAALREGMTTEEGVEVLARVLDFPLARVGISSQRLDALLAAGSAPDERAMPAPLATSSGDDDRAYLAPRSELERGIAALWQELLGVARVGAEDNFFELGGDSVIGLQFIARARRMGLTVSNKDLFQHQTVAALAAACGGASAGADSAVPRDAGADAGAVDGARLVANLGGAAAVEDVYPLAPMQLGMLYHSLDAPASGVYCSRLAYTLRGPLDPDAFGRAWQDLLARHAILRSSFHHEDLAQPLQAVHTRAALDIARDDWRALPADAREARLAALLDDEGRRGFDFAAPPLMRLALVRWSEDEWQFVLVHHHLLMDGWCRAQLFEELFHCYAARRAGRAPELAPPHPYRLFIDWLASRDLAAAERYWREVLAGFRTPLAVPGDLDADAPGEVLEYRFELDAAASAALATELRRRRLTLGTAVSGAWALWLAAQAGVDDVVFGTTIAGRPASLPEAERIVGLFINTLATRARIDADAPFGAWLAALQIAQAESRQYEQTPLAAIQDWAETPRGARLFETLVVIENSAGFHGGPERHGEIEITATRPVIRNSYPLTLRAVPGSTLQLQLLYDSARFSAARVAAIAADVLALLAAVVEADGVSLGALRARLDAARQRYEAARHEDFRDQSRARLKSIRRRPQ